MTTAVEPLQISRLDRDAPLRDVASYRGAAVPFLAGTPRAHATAVAACQGLIACVGAR